MDMTNVDRRAQKDGRAAIEPISAPVSEICRITGLSPTEIYRKLVAGDIKGVKCGRRTLVLLDSVRSHIAALPPATFREPAAKSAS